MPHVPKELIDTTWRAVGALSEERIPKIQKAHRKAQRALTIFVYKQFADFREDAAGVGIYVFHVVLEAFSRSLPRPRSVRSAQIERAFGHHHQPEAFDPERAIGQSPEPHALRYAYEALTEDADDVTLSEQELEHIFGVLHAVISCLHDACEREWNETDA